MASKITFTLCGAVIGAAFSDIQIWFSRPPAWWEALGTENAIARLLGGALAGAVMAGALGFFIALVSGRARRQSQSDRDNS
jgi:hypothetical protein